MKKIGLIALLVLGYGHYNYLSNQEVEQSVEVQAEYDRLKDERDKYAQLYQDALSDHDVATETRRKYLTRVMQLNAALATLRERGAKE